MGARVRGCVGLTGDTSVGVGRVLVTDRREGREDCDRRDVCPLGSPELLARLEFVLVLLELEELQAELFNVVLEGDLVLLPLAVLLLHHGEVLLALRLPLAVAFLQPLCPPRVLLHQTGVALCLLLQLAVDVIELALHLSHHLAVEVLLLLYVLLVFLNQLRPLLDAVLQLCPELCLSTRPLEPLCLMFESEVLGLLLGQLQAHCHLHGLLLQLLLLRHHLAVFLLQCLVRRQQLVLLVAERSHQLLHLLLVLRLLPLCFVLLLLQAGTEVGHLRLCGSSLLLLLLLHFVNLRLPCRLLFL
mmetsp:Transcript_8679/g.36166  ORF Transcript_8679/g.36166 Transcript_8679/m.36166 type:complete len:301 (-) Transcript_8679:3444-4346(-)